MQARGGRGGQRRLLGGVPEAGIGRFERPGRQRRDDRAAAGPRLPRQVVVAAGSGDEHVGVTDRGGPLGRVLGASHVHPAARGRRDVRPHRPAGVPAPDEDELEHGRGRHGLHERAQGRAALARPFGGDLRALLGPGLELLRDPGRDDRVLAGVDWARLRPPPDPTSRRARRSARGSGHGPGRGPGRPSRGRRRSGRSRRRAPARGGWRPLRAPEGAARGRGRRRSRRRSRRARRWRWPRPGGRHRGAVRAGAAARPASSPPGAARPRGRAAPLCRRSPAPAAAAGRCEGRASTGSARARSPGGRTSPAPWRRRGRARPPGARRRVRTARPGRAAVGSRLRLGPLLGAGRGARVVGDEPLDLVAALRRRRAAPAATS